MKQLQHISSYGTRLLLIVGLLAGFLALNLDGGYPAFADGDQQEADLAEADQSAPDSNHEKACLQVADAITASVHIHIPQDFLLLDVLGLPSDEDGEALDDPGQPSVTCRFLQTLFRRIASPNAP